MSSPSTSTAKSTAISCRWYDPRPSLMRGRPHEGASPSTRIAQRRKLHTDARASHRRASFAGIAPHIAYDCDANFTQTRELRRLRQAASTLSHPPPPAKFFSAPASCPVCSCKDRNARQAAHFPNNHFPPPLQSLWRPEMNTMGVENNHMRGKSAVGFSQAPMKHASTLSHPQQAATFNVYGRGRWGEPALKGII